MRAKYHSPGSPAPIWTYVLMVYSPAAEERQSVNDPALLVGERWFKLRHKAFAALLEEEGEGRHVERIT